MRHIYFHMLKKYRIIGMFLGDSCQHLRYFVPVLLLVYLCGHKFGCAEFNWSSEHLVKDVKLYSFSVLQRVPFVSRISKIFQSYPFVILSLPVRKLLLILKEKFVIVSFCKIFRNSLHRYKSVVPRKINVVLQEIKISGVRSFF